MHTYLESFHQYMLSIKAVQFYVERKSISLCQRSPFGLTHHPLTSSIVNSSTGHIRSHSCCIYFCSLSSGPSVPFIAPFVYPWTLNHWNDHHTDAKILKMRRKEYNEPRGKAVMWYCTTLYLFISHTVWNVHLNMAAWGYHTAWASAHLIPMLGFHSCSPAVHYAGTGHQCSIYLSVSPPDNYSKEEVISCSGLSHVTRKHNGLCF